MDHSFDKRHRLLKTEEFSSVFAFRKYASHEFLQTWRMDNQMGHARLGIIISKKVAKRANKRNYMKRKIREWFRLHKHQLPAQDFIVRVRVVFSHEHHKRIDEQLAQLLLPPNKMDKF